MNLIERLRKCGVTAESKQAAHEAANEIERLTAERNAFQDQCISLKMKMTIMREERDMLAEVLESFDAAAKESKSIIGFAGKALKLVQNARAALAKVKK